MEKEQRHRKPSDEMQRAAYEYNEKKYKYDAFISYRHVEPDQSIAKQVHQMIETFKPPKEFYEDGKKPTFRVFRDREELAARDLSASIEEALETSRYLIVICSKRTPLSDWCQKEIETFKSLHGDERIIPVLIEGEPDESFPQALKELKRGDNESLQDVLAADIRPDEILKADFSGYENLQNNNISKLKELTKESLKLLKIEKYRIMATILGCSFGDLKQRDKERKNKLILTVSSMAGAVFLIFGLFMANAYQKAEIARQDAVQSNAGILMKTAKDFLEEGDYIKAVLVAKEAMLPIKKDMKHYDTLKAEEFSIFNSTIYHSGASTLTNISTKNKFTYMAISEDEKYVAYGLDNNDTAIASVENGEVLKRFTGHTQQVKFVDFSKDGKYLASSSFDNTCIIYDIENGEEVSKLEIEGVPMLAKFSKDNTKLYYVTIVNDDTCFYVYDTNTWQKHGGFVINGQVKYADIKSDGSEVLIALEDNTEEQLTRISLKDGSIIDIIPRIKGVNLEQNEFDKPYKAAMYSADGKNIILLTEGEIMKISLEDRTEIFKQDIYINPNDTRVLTESYNGEKIAVKAGTQVYILDGKNGEVTDEIYFPELNMRYFTYNYNTNTVVGFGENGNYSIWKDKIIVENNLSYGGGVPTEFIYLKDGSKILANSHESQTIKIIDLKSRVLSEPIYARIIANSDDFSYMLLFDGSGFVLSDDDGKTSKKINPDEPTTYGIMSKPKYNRISNDGRYYAYIGMTKDALSDAKPILKLYDVQNDINKQLVINTTSTAFVFSNDSKQILLLDSAEGLRIYDTESLELIKSYNNIKDESGVIKLLINSEILVINRFAGIASVYNLDTNEHIVDIPGEVVNIQKADGEIKLRGIQNNTAFYWSDKDGLSKWEMDETCAETALSFNDVNLYNEDADILMMIRNNETDRKCYVVDFSTGRLNMTLSPSVKDYNVNGHISPEGRLIAIDQNYYVNFDKDSTKSQYYMASAVYKLLNEDEVNAEIEGIIAGRKLSQEEKVQIGIIAK